MERSRRGAETEAGTPTHGRAVHPGWRGELRGAATDSAGAAGEEPVDGGEEAEARPPGGAAAAFARGADAELAAEVGRRIRRARARAGVSQEALAGRVGCARPTVCRWEWGRRLPALGALVRVAATLGVAPAALLPRSDGEG